MTNRIGPDPDIYAQDCEFYRYQDQLMWSRFQTAALLEGAVLYAVYELTRSLGAGEKRLLMAAGFLLVLVLSLVTLKDRADAARHLNRIRQYEAERPLSASAWPSNLGYYLLLCAALIINAANVLLFVSRW